MTGLAGGRAAGPCPQPNGTAVRKRRPAAAGRRRAGRLSGRRLRGAAEHGIEPTWIAGISIGAINSAIIAGNRPANASPGCASSGSRRAQPPATAAGPAGCRICIAQFDGPRGWSTSSRPAACADQGRARLLQPRFPPPPLPAGGLGATSWYDTASSSRRWSGWSISIASTREMRFSVGAVNVEHRQFRLFRQCHRYDPRRAYHGQRRAAAGLPAGRDRRRTLLGRRAWFRTPRSTGCCRRGPISTH
jgi:NTE family protein